MKTGSLKQKLIIRNSLTLVFVFIAFVMVFTIYQNNLYQERVGKIEREGQQNLLAKGLLLVRDKSITLRSHISGNAWGDIRQVLADNVAADEDIVLGGFVRYPDYLTRAWVNENNPSGEIFKPGTLDLMEGLSDVVETTTGRPLLKNNLTRWALQLDEYGSREVTEGGARYLEFAAPIYISEEEEDEILGEDQKAGVVVYRLSFKKTLKAIEEETADNSVNQRNTLLIMVLLALAAIGAGVIATQRQAATITQPLGVLTSAAETISHGNYDVEVKISSGDEIETLGTAFNQMVRDLERSYADLRTRNIQLEEARSELEDLNRHLEEKVEERTKQLADSESKFRTLFEESADAILLGSEDSFLDCNPAMLQIMGCRTKTELLSMTLDDISPEFQPDETPSSEKMHGYFSVARSEGSRQFEWVNRRIDGTEFYSEIVITSFPLNGKQVLHMVFRDITERKQTEEALRVAQQKLVETAHSAGMAEIATGVLHNIGNILNSVNISTEEISGTLKSSKIKGFIKANDLVKVNMESLGYFFTDHPKGKLIPGYYISLGEAIKEEHQIMTDEIKALCDKVSMMRDVISTQQNYAKATLYTEDVVVTELVDDALKLQLASLRKQGVKISKDFRSHPRGMVSKVKLVHVLTNLIKNGKEAMGGNEKLHKPQEMIIRIEEPEANLVQIKVIDNGCGIHPGNLEKIFNHGFTTKKSGHGFGLHTCANFMTEMGGSLVAESDGVGEGSTFVLRFPIVQPDKSEMMVHT